MSQSERRAAKPRRARRTKAEMQAEREQLEFKKNDVVEDDEDVEKPRRGRPRVNKFKEVETQGNTDVAPTPYQQIYNELQDDMKMLKEKSFEDDMMITNLRNTVSSLKRIRNEYDEKIGDLKNVVFTGLNMSNAPALRNTNLYLENENTQNKVEEVDSSNSFSFGYDPFDIENNYYYSQEIFF